MTLTPPEGRCPFHSFDPFRQDGMHEALAEARREAPVFHHPTPKAWVVTRYADAVAVFRDPERFSARVALTPVATSPEIVGPVLKAGHYMGVSTNADLDPPGHGRIRRRAMPLIGTRRLEQLEPEVRQIIDDALDRLPTSGRVALVSSLSPGAAARWSMSRWAGWPSRAPRCCFRSPPVTATRLSFPSPTPS